jgi:hypothetical protein
LPVNERLSKLDKRKGESMNLKIGVVQVAKEIEIELPDDTDRQDLAKEIVEKVTNGDALLWFSDKRSRQIAVAVSKIAYIEFDPENQERKVGFSPR